MSDNKISFVKFDELHPIEQLQYEVFQKFQPGTIWSLNFFDFNFMYPTGVDDERFLEAIKPWVTQGVREISKFRIRAFSCDLLVLKPELPIVILDSWFQMSRPRSRSPVYQAKSPLKGLRVFEVRDPLCRGKLHQVVHINSSFLLKIIHQEKTCFVKLNIPMLYPAITSEDGWRVAGDLYKKEVARGWGKGHFEWCDFWTNLTP
jgi:hypothetical protein